MVRIINALVLLTCLFASYACVKDKGLPPQTVKTIANPDTIIPPLVFPDSILYVDLTDTTIRSVISFSSAGPCNVPIPSDTSVAYFLDIDGDLLNDIMLECATHPWVGGSSPCSSYQCNIMLTLPGSAQEDSVLFGQQTMGCDALSFGDNIAVGMHFISSYGAIRIGAPGFNWNVPANMDKYIGFKLKRNNSIMHGWILINIGTDHNSLTLKSFALNRTHNNDITAGQTN